MKLNDANSFAPLTSLPTPLSLCQCVTYKQEIIICGGADKRVCYSYHTLRNQYKLICSYPNDVRLFGHCVVKLRDSNRNEMTLLSFGGKYKHTLMMNYVSVWEEDEDIETTDTRHCNEWLPFTDNDNNIVTIGGDRDNYWGVRAVIGGSHNHLLFITYPSKKLDVFDLNTYQYVSHNTLPTGNTSICNHCFVSITANSAKIKGRKHRDVMILFSEKTGLLIAYDEYKNAFQCRRLQVCETIGEFNFYAYVYIDGAILFFGGWNGYLGAEMVVSKALHMYSIRQDKWIQFEQTLPVPLYGCAGILNDDRTWVHILGGFEGNKTVSTHLKTNANEWVNAFIKKVDIEREREKIKKERKELEGMRPELQIKMLKNVIYHMFLFLFLFFVLVICV
ncbi:hypothetical protein RFI_28215, partial [Reticulomyxa filosa]